MCPGSLGRSAQAPSTLPAGLSSPLCRAPRPGVRGPWVHRGTCRRCWQEGVLLAARLLGAQTQEDQRERHRVVIGTGYSFQAAPSAPLGLALDPVGSAVESAPSGEGGTRSRERKRFAQSSEGLPWQSPQSHAPGSKFKAALSVRTSHLPAFRPRPGRGLGQHPHTLWSQTLSGLQVSEALCMRVYSSIVTVLAIKALKLQQCCY